MNTHSHAFFTFAALHQVEGASLAVAGSALPDALYYLAVPLLAARRGISYREAQAEVYRVPALRRMVDALHAVPVLALVSLAAWLWCPPLLMLCLGWASHLLIDFLTHGEGSHPHLWPLSSWKFKSPISFYEEDRFGRPFMLLEHALMFGIVFYWIKTGFLGTQTLALLAGNAGLALLAAFSVATLVAYVVHLRQRRCGVARRGAGLVAALGIE